MKILGIDYGRSKIGLAFSVGGIPEPYKVIRVHSFDDALQKITRVIETEKPEKTVVGVSEGEMGKESKRFADSIGAEIFDETLSTLDAQRLSREAGIGRKKRNEMEDAFAASIMLQNYLNNKV